MRAGLQPADLRVRGAVVRRAVPRDGQQGVHLPRSPGGEVSCQGQSLQAVLQEPLRGDHHGGGDAVPLLQPGAGRGGGAHLLASGRLLPRGDVHRSEEGEGVDAVMGRPGGLQRRLPGGQRRDLRGIPGGDHQGEVHVERGRLPEMICPRVKINAIFFVLEMFRIFHGEGNGSRYAKSHQ